MSSFQPIAQPNVIVAFFWLQAVSDSESSSKFFSLLLSERPFRGDVFLETEIPGRFSSGIRSPIHLNYSTILAPHIV